MNQHEKQNGINPILGGAAWPTPRPTFLGRLKARFGFLSRRPSGGTETEPIPLDTIRELRKRGLKVEPCPDDDGRWHCGDYCSSAEGLKQRLSDER
jgi:hypothetical protein